MDLFGGAIRVDYWPFTGLLDASLIRQVPDHQEVFLFKDNDDSVIFEIVVHDDKMTLKDHFKDIAECNDCNEYSVLATHGDCLWGRQHSVSKFNKKREGITLFLGRRQFTEHQADILLSINFCQEPSISFDEFQRIVESIRLVDPALFT